MGRVIAALAVVMVVAIARSCGQNPNCHMVMGADGTIITTP